MITSTILVFALSLGRTLSLLPAAKADRDSSPRGYVNVELRISITAHAVAVATCALVLVWGVVLGLLGLP